MLRRCLLGRNSRLVFGRAIDQELPSIESTGLYVHIPFCRSMCPYCPYNKVPYDRSLVGPYVEAVLEEVERYHERLGRVEVTSLYIGGGTPTNLVDELGVIIRSITEKFAVTGDICAETTPADLDEETTKKLVESGVSLISVGVQSFDDRYLELLGRNYRVGTVFPAMERVRSSGFSTVNVDLMFALPGQTVEDVIRDIDTALESGADQVTLYPLFTFPYTTAGKYLKVRQIRMPSLRLRRRMYRAIHEHCLSRGLERVSVWGFKRRASPRYSSVTRDTYIGLGAGAGSHVPGLFYFNTFSVPEYVNACLSHRPARALEMELAPVVSRYYWLYWRLYETHVSTEDMLAMFKGADRGLRVLLDVARALRFCKEDGPILSLSERGAFWLHLMQNYFVLPYIDRVWSAAMREPWPEEVRL